jgi:tetratricopeptide (TPR) repeat protein
MVDASARTDSGRFRGLRIAFAGKLGGLTKREAMALVRQHGGVPVDGVGESVDLLVIGAEQLPLDAPDLLDESARRAVDEGRLSVLSETEFWSELGLLEDDQAVHRLYTPAMLAELLKIPLATIRRWHRRGLIVPVREVHRLPYFDFREVSAARQLAGLLAAGMSAAAIEKKLGMLARFVPGMDRSLRQLAIIVEGREILLRQGEGLVEPNGQLRFDFEASAGALVELPAAAAPAATADSSPESTASGGTSAELLRWAVEQEEQGQLAQAAETYRAALAAGGPRAEICFQLAELLYRLGDVSGARERYYMAIELNEDLVEARASLGCVLAESGDLELAVAAFQGALLHHPYYADVHYHLARTLGELGRDEEAREHWLAFLRLTPDSPWADEAGLWLNVSESDTVTT